MTKKHTPYYREYSDAHRTFHDVASETAGLKIKDHLNGYVPEDLVEKHEAERKMIAEIKILSPEDGSALIEKIVSTAEDNGAVVEQNLENDTPQPDKPARRYVMARFFDASYIMARRSLYLGDQHARIYFEAVRGGEDHQGAQ
ncbi:hypothetical protein [Chromohalobacter canadensis]|nr:hypothetical protein [Chromohalobacter canadensis]